MADLKDDDIVGYTAQVTPIRVGQNITETDGPGFFEGITSALRLGEGDPFVEERGGRQDERGLAALRPPMQTGPSLMTQPIQNLPITTQPVDANIVNQYLALAGFSPPRIFPARLAIPSPPVRRPVAIDPSGLAIKPAALASPGKSCASC